MRKLLRRPSPAMIVACIALLVALGGTSVAAVNQLARNTHRGQLRLTDTDRDLLREAIETNRKLENILDDIVGHVRSRRGYMTAVALAQEKARAERATSAQRSRDQPTRTGESLAKVHLESNMKA